MKKGKNMNKVIKMLIKEIIHNNLLAHIKTASGDRYVIFAPNGTEILSIDNGWAKNNYSISVNNKIILSVRWDESNSRPLNHDQKDMLDIINTSKEKMDLQETAQTMNGSELETANFLQKFLCDIKK